MFSDQTRLKMCILNNPLLHRSSSKTFNPVGGASAAPSPARLLCFSSDLHHLLIGSRPVRMSRTSMCCFHSAALIKVLTFSGNYLHNHLAGLQLSECLPAHSCESVVSFSYKTPTEFAYWIFSCRHQTGDARILHFSSSFCEQFVPFCFGGNKNEMI